MPNGQVPDDRRRPEAAERDVRSCGRAVWSAEAQRRDARGRGPANSNVVDEPSRQADEQPGTTRGTGIGPIVALALLLSGCAQTASRPEPVRSLPAWQATVLPPAPMAVAPPPPALPVAPPAHSNPPPPVAPRAAPSVPGRDPCLSRWGSPRLDAPVERCRGGDHPRSSQIPVGGGTYKVGKPYVIRGVIYHPREDPSYDRTGIASFYDRGFHGRRTANGEVFDTFGLNAAHPTLPMPSYARVTNLENGRTILVRINNRGPYVPGRIIDLSRRAAELLDFSHKGLATVRVTYAGRAPLDGNDHAERAFLARQPWFRPTSLAADR